MSRWVQHISGQGAKYELTDNIWNREDNSSWRVYNPVNKDFNWLYLPRADYRECPPPRRRMTGECYIQSGGNALGFRRCDLRTSFLGTTWALIRKEDLTDGEVCLVIEEGE